MGESGRGFGLEVMKISKFVRFPSVYKNSVSIYGLVCHYIVHWSAWKKKNIYRRIQDGSEDHQIRQKPLEQTL